MCLCCMLHFALCHIMLLAVSKINNTQHASPGGEGGSSLAMCGRFGCIFKATAGYKMGVRWAFHMRMHNVHLNNGPCVTSVAKKSQSRITMLMAMAMATCGFIRGQATKKKRATRMVQTRLLAGRVCARQLGCSVVPQVGS